MCPAQLSDFLGTWRFDRRVTPFDGTPEAHAIGEARIAAFRDAWLYTEEAHLTLAGQARPVVATRRYLWHARDKGIDICFEDGRFFHHMALGAERTQAAHWCDPDQYDVRYDFSSWPRWEAHWRVRGPRKDYSMITRYEFANHPG